MVFSWKIRLTAICNAAVLSQYNNVGFGCNILKSVNNERSQDNSQHAPVMALYSASTEEEIRFFVSLSAKK